MLNDTLPLDKVHAYARSRADTDGLVATPVPGLRLMCLERPGPKVRSTYKPLVCLVLQGAKKLLVGRHDTVCRGGQSVIVGAAMPVTGQVVEASVTAPYLAVAIELDMGVLSEQAARFDAAPAAAHVSAGRTLFTEPTGAAVFDCGRRLLQLVTSPRPSRSCGQGSSRKCSTGCCAAPTERHCVPWCRPTAPPAG